MSQATFELRRWHPALLLLLGLLGPPAIAFFHLVLMIIIRAETPNFPIDFPIEYISLLSSLVGLPILLHRRGAPVWLLVLTLMISGFIALIGGLLALFITGGLSSGLPKC